MASHDASLPRQLTRLLWPRGEPTMQARVVAAAVLVLAAKALSVTAPFLYKKVVDGLSSPATVAAPLLLIAAYGGARIAAEVTEELRRIVFIPVAQRAVRMISLEAFGRLHGLSLRFHLDRQTGGVSRSVHRGAAALQMLLELSVFSLLPALVELALVGGILWRFYDAGFAAAAVAAIAAYLGFTLWATGLQVRLRREMNTSDVAANVVAIDSLLNYETVKYFAAESEEQARFEGARRAYERAAVRSQSVEAAVRVGQAALMALGAVGLMIMAARGVAAGRMSIGDFVLVNAYLLQLYAPLNMLGTVYSIVKQALTDLEALLELIRLRPEVQDRPGAAPLAVAGGDVVFDDVSFAYDPRRPILDRVSFEIPPGATVAVVGATGGGKSTLARLLFRFYDPTSGAVRIDGQDLRDVTQDSVRRAIGVVPQDTVLFNETIFYNIAYGRPGATRAEVEEAARLARLHDFIARLPDGYDTRVGERGLKLSGGEKQRVAIARVILKNPQILVFDEATSALDTHTEREIQASLGEVAARRSTLVIAHRLSTIVDADQILVMEHGRIVERGRHDELLARGGAYAALWRRQQKDRPAAALAPG